jgi:hypothetical protein
MVLRKSEVLVMTTVRGFPHFHRATPSVELSPKKSKTGHFLATSQD